MWEWVASLARLAGVAWWEGSVRQCKARKDREKNKKHESRLANGAQTGWLSGIMKGREKKSGESKS